MESNIFLCIMCWIILIKRNEIVRGGAEYESMHKENCGNTCGADSLVVLSHARRIRFLRNLFRGKLWNS